VIKALIAAYFAQPRLKRIFDKQSPEGREKTIAALRDAADMLEAGNTAGAAAVVADLLSIIR
jgi:hypothetical protein